MWPLGWPRPTPQARPAARGVHDPHPRLDLLPAVSRKSTPAYVPLVMQLPLKTTGQLVNLLPPRVASFKEKLAQGCQLEYLFEAFGSKYFRSSSKAQQTPAKFDGLLAFSPNGCVIC